MSPRRLSLSLSPAYFFVHLSSNGTVFFTDSGGKDCRYRSKVFVIQNVLERATFFPFVVSQILQVTAVDLDTGNNARLSYRLQGSTAFRISPNTGWIYLAQALDRESSDRHALTVLATDNGSPAATASTSVLVTVLDDNDNDPRFEKEFYGFELLENLPSGTLVGSVSASDPDLGKNALLRYAVVQANSSFTVDPDTGKTTTPFPYIYIFILECLRNLGQQLQLQIDRPTRGEKKIFANPLLLFCARSTWTANIERSRRRTGEALLASEEEGSIDFLNNPSPFASQLGRVRGTSVPILFRSGEKGRVWGSTGRERRPPEFGARVR